MNVTLKLPAPRVGLTPDRGSRAQKRRPAAWILLSALLHVAVLVALLISKRSPEMPADQVGAPSVEMMFESPKSAEQATPAAPQFETVPTPGESSTTPTAPPEENATQPGAPPPAPEPAPQPAPQQPAAPPEAAPPTAAAPPELAPPPPIPAVPEQAPVEQTPTPPSAPPAVRLDEPDTVMLPPPVAVPEAPPRPAPPTPAQPRSAPNPFAGAIMLGGPITFHQPPGRPMRSGGAPSRAIDLSLGPVSAEPIVSGRYAEARKAAAAGDWNSLFAAWFEQHKYYPASAAEKGEEGSSTVEMTVDRYGHVTAASLVVTSGSDRLDAALLGTLRGATVPPPLPGMPTPFTATVTLHYVLIR